MSIRCLAGICHAPAPPHHRLLPRANSCLALFPTPQLPLWSIPHLNPYPLSILSLLAFHPSPSPSALSIPLSFPHRPTPILSSFLSMACVLKRFPLALPRKLPLTCVKPGFLRTAGLHGSPQLSPCEPQVSQCMSMRCLAVMCHAPAPSHYRLLPRANSCLALFPTPQLPPCAIPHLNPYSLPITFPTHFPSFPYPLSILSLPTFHHSPATLAVPLSFPHRPSPILAAFPSLACVLKRFPLTSPRK